MKYFILTIDTEGDNLWRNNCDDKITTLNSHYLPRFQSLCEKYGYMPTYLANYEMLNDKFFVENAKDWASSGNCEIGLHLHAWNTPPTYNLNGNYNGLPYLIEYPIEVMRAKLKTVFDLYVSIFGECPVSHRAGRWAMDDNYFGLLHEFGIKVDSSVTPGKDWSKDLGATRGGSDYTTFRNGLQYINGIMEVPPTILTLRHWDWGYWKRTLKYLIIGEQIEIRPSISPIKSMIKLVNHIDKAVNIDYIQFMIHSSELMPDGSPYFPSEQSIESLYETMDTLFSHLKNCHYIGATLKSYYEKHCK